MRADLYPLYGGYWGYRAAPLRDVQEQRCVLIVKKKLEAEELAEMKQDAATQKAELERANRYGR